MEDTGSKPELSRPLTTEYFFKGFLACLMLQDSSRVITTLGDRHQAAFRAAYAHLETQRAEGDSATARMPELYPGPITGTYDELDGALIWGQRTGTTRPDGSSHFAYVEITMSEARARGILERFFTDEEQVLLSEMASQFIKTHYADPSAEL